MANLIWIHEDALRADHPVFEAAGKEAAALYVWDDAYLKEMGYGMKRLVFMYEAVCTLPVTIIRGDTKEVLDEVSGEKLFVPKTPNPTLCAIAGSLSKPVNWVADEPFVVLNKTPELKRFFRYWNKAKKVALKPNGGADA